MSFKRGLYYYSYRGGQLYHGLHGALKITCLETKTKFPSSKFNFIFRKIFIAFSFRKIMNYGRLENIIFLTNAFKKAYILTH